MVTMITDRPFTYAGRDLSKGVEFECADEHVKLFETIEFAHAKAGKQESGKQEYKTRVMTAKGARNRRVEAA